MASSQAGHLLIRNRLLDRLDEGTQKKLCLITAQAGYGKTVLLEHWYPVARKNRVPVCLIRLGDAENEPFALLSSITDALAGIGVAPGYLTPPQNALHTGGSAHVAVQSLANVLRTCDRDMVLVFDGFENIRNHDALRLVDQMLHYFPDAVHFVISSRDVPNIRLSEYKVRNRMDLITQSDLAFTVEEVREFAAGGWGGDAAPEMLDVLQQKTEGWPVAVEIALKRADGKSDPLSEIQSFSGRISDLSEYLQEQILLDQEDQIKIVLMRMSLLDRFNGDLVNLLCGRKDGWDVLDRLHRRNLLVVMDEERSWFRFNVLFAEFLKEFRDRREGGRTRDCHLLACKWFFENNHFPEALRHAWMASDVDGVAKLLNEMGGWRLIFDGRADLLHAYFNRLPAEIVQRYPRLRLAEVFMLLKDGEIAHGEKQYTELQAQLEAQQAGNPLLVSEAQIVGAYLSGYSDRPQTPEYLTFLKELKISLPPSDRFLLGDVENNLTIAHYELGHFGEAADSARRAINCYRAIRSLYGEIFIYIHLGMAYYAQGRLRDAKATWDEGHLMALENYGDGSHIAALLAVHLAMVEYELNRLSEAKVHIEKSLDLLEISDCWCNVYIVGYLTAARLNRTMGGVDSALKVLERATGTARARGLPRLELVADIERVVVYALSGASEQAQKLADTIDLQQIYKGEQNGIAATRTVREAAGIALARLSFVRGEYKNAVRLLDELAEETQGIGHYMRFVEVLVIKAMCQYQQENATQALATIDAALSLMVFERNARVFLNEGVYMHNLLGLAQRRLTFQHGNDPKAEYLAELLKAFKQQEDGGAQGVTDQRLSHRENELALLLIQGLQNKQIAARLSISENTVKYHLKQLYKKLDVASRKEAIRCISENRLIGY